MKYYIASGLENVVQVCMVRDCLNAAGWEHTYDWTVHGSVQREGVDRLAEVSADEAEGVCDADVIIVLLPGGRGTHTEFGMAIGLNHAMFPAPFRVVIFSPDPEKDFGTNGTCCAFYFHPCVERYISIPEMIAALVKDDK